MKKIVTRIDDPGERADLGDPLRDRPVLVAELDLAGAGGGDVALGELDRLPPLGIEEAVREPEQDDHRDHPDGHEQVAELPGGR